MTEKPFGGFWRRSMAFFIDKAILFFISLLILFVGLLALWIGFPARYRDILPGGLAQLSITFLIAYIFMAALLHMLYFTYFHGTNGQTPGKMILGLQVVQSTGEEMTLGIAFLRWVGYFASTVLFYIGFLWIAVDGKKQGWHDKIAGTLVIRKGNVVDGLSYPTNEKTLDKDRDIL